MPTWLTLVIGIGAYLVIMSIIIGVKEYKRHKEKKKIEKEVQDYE